MSCIPQTISEDTQRILNNYLNAERDKERSEILQDALTPVRYFNPPSVKKSEFVSEIEKLEKQSELLAWIIATLTLPQNQEHFPKLLIEVVTEWKQRFEAMK